MKHKFTPSIVVMAFTFLLAAQTTAPSLTDHNGCVMEDEHVAGRFTLCEPDQCTVLTGTFTGAKLAGHTVVLRGVLHTATSRAPRTLDVSTVVSVGGACTLHCTPRPPGGRGVGDESGTQLGTPGAVSPDPHP